MITDADIKKMKAVFATKDDLKAFATKEDLKKFMTKEDLRRSTDQLVELITIGFNRTDKAIERLSEHDDMIDNHEHRLDRIEDKVFA